MENINIDIENLPTNFGCYIFKNKFSEIIYIGKSKNIKKRVKQYFGTITDTRSKIKSLSKEIKTIEYILTDSESDALLLECHLIKKYQPKYNSMLKYDKVFPFIKINPSSEYPTITLSKETNSTDKYYGFFYSEREALSTIELIGEIWKMPTCNKVTFSRNHRACLRYHIGKCLAPCEKKIDSAQYKKVVNEAISFLNGKHKNIISRLDRQLNNIINSLEFEKSQKIYENLENLKRLNRKVKRFNTSLKNKNLHLLFRAFNEKELYIFYIKNEVLLSQKRFKIEELNLTTIEGYFLEIEKHNYTPPHEFLLTGHLLEIVADKYFIEISEKSKIDNKTTYLMDKINEFLTHDDD